MAVETLQGERMVLFEDFDGWEVLWWGLFPSMTTNGGYDYGYRSYLLAWPNDARARTGRHLVTACSDLWPGLAWVKEGDSFPRFPGDTLTGTTLQAAAPGAWEDTTKAKGRPRPSGWLEPMDEALDLLLEAVRTANEQDGEIDCAWVRAGWVEHHEDMLRRAVNAHLDAYDRQQRGTGPKLGPSSFRRGEMLRYRLAMLDEERSNVTGKPGVLTEALLRKAFVKIERQREQPEVHTAPWTSGDVAMLKAAINGEPDPARGPEMRYRPAQDFSRASTMNYELLAPVYAPCRKKPEEWYGTQPLEYPEAVSL